MLFKLFILRRHQKTWCFIFEEASKIEEIELSIERDKENGNFIFSEHIQAYRLRFQKFKKVITIIFITCSIVYLLAPFIEYCVRKLTQSESIGLPHIVQIWTPLDNDSWVGYIITLLFECIIMWYNVSTHLVFDLTSIGVMVFIIGQFSLICHYSEEIGCKEEIFQSKRGDDLAHNQIIMCHQIYVRIKYVTDKLKKLLTNLLGVYFLISTILLGCVVVRVNSSKSERTPFLLLVTGLLISMNAVDNETVIEQYCEKFTTLSLGTKELASVGWCLSVTPTIGPSDWLSEVADEPESVVCISEILIPPYDEYVETIPVDDMSVVAQTLSHENRNNKELDTDVLEILGEDPSHTQNVGNNIRPELIDSLLFGEELAGILKTAKLINKSGTELKADPPTKNLPKRSKIPLQNHLNRKAPGSAYRLPGPSQRSYEPAGRRLLPPPPLARSSRQWPRQQQHHLPPPPPPPPPAAGRAAVSKQTQMTSAIACLGEIISNELNFKNKDKERLVKIESRPTYKKPTQEVENTPPEPFKPESSGFGVQAARPISEELRACRPPPTSPAAARALFKAVAASAAASSAAATAAATTSGGPPQLSTLADCFTFGNNGHLSLMILRSFLG
ncbi:unnamed protein product [Chilo suppressalis]|uniref:Odorant receptor n=1 Tax=Chilo suppressalis TaxID=168631 RepID=A0ABN8BHI8_CHISP|nr:unnamed protein product [Chilo suppressalis]